MKKTILPAIPAVLSFLVAAALGVAKRSSYTDISDQSGYIGQLQVAQIPDEIAVEACKKLERALPECPVVLRVKAAGEMEYLFGDGRQKVCIEKVYKGDGLETGQEIYIYANGWRLSLHGDPDSVECNFVNIMKPDTEYLVFISCLASSLDEALLSYQLYDEQIIAPVFCYEKRTNKIMPMKGEGTYVPYVDVSQNEFFAAGKKGLAAWELLKSKMLSLYMKTSG